MWFWKQIFGPAYIFACIPMNFLGKTSTWFQMVNETTFLADLVSISIFKKCFSCLRRQCLKITTSCLNIINKTESKQKIKDNSKYLNYISNTFMSTIIIKCF